MGHRTAPRRQRVAPRSKRERVKRKTTEDKMAPAMTAAKRNFMGKSVVARQTRAARAVARRNASLVVKAGAYDEELIATANTIASKGRGILAMDESNGTCGKRLDSIGVENTEDNRRAYRQLLVTTPGLGEYISGAIMFEETLYQSSSEGKTFVDCLKEQGIVPGIKVQGTRPHGQLQRGVLVPGTRRPRREVR